MTLRRLCLILCCCLLSACSDTEAPSPDSAKRPEQQLMALAEALRGDDVAAAIELAVPPRTRTRWRDLWQARRNVPFSAPTRQRYADFVAQLQSPERRAAMASDIADKAREWRSHLPGLVRVLSGTLRMALDVPDDGRDGLLAVTESITVWAERTPFDDAERIERILAKLAQGLDRAGFDDLPTIRQFSFDELLKRSEHLLAAVKSALQELSFNADIWLEQLSVETLSNNGTSAQVRLRFPLADQPHELLLPMVKRDERWYSEAAVRAEPPPAPTLDELTGKSTSPPETQE